MISSDLPDGYIEGLIQRAKLGEQIQGATLVNPYDEFTIYSRSTGRIMFLADGRNVVSKQRESVETFKATLPNASDWYVSTYRK